MVRVVEPFPFEALPRVWVWTQDFRRAVVDDFGPKTLEEFIDQWEALEGRRRTWGVWRGEELGGLVVYEPWTPVTGASHCLFKKSFWGHETTLEALREVYRQVFEGGVQKITNQVFAHNSNVIAMGKALGAHREGTLREHTMQNGKPVDVAVLSLFAADFMTEKKEVA